MQRLSEFDCRGHERPLGLVMMPVRALAMGRHFQSVRFDPDLIDANR